MRKLGDANLNIGECSSSPTRFHSVSAANSEWPKTREAQAKAGAGALRESDGPVTPDELAKRFTRAQRDTIEELLQAMVTLGLARRVRGGKFVG